MQDIERWIDQLERSLQRPACPTCGRGLVCHTCDRPAWDLARLSAAELEELRRLLDKANGKEQA